MAVAALAAGKVEVLGTAKFFAVLLGYGRVSVYRITREELLANKEFSITIVYLRI